MKWSDFSRRYASFLQRHSFAVVLIGLFLTAGSGYLITKLRLDSDLGSMLPDDYPSVQALTKIRDKYGGVGNIRILLTSDNLDSAKAFANVIAEELARKPDILYVDYRIDKAFFRQRSLLFMAQEDLEEIRDRISYRINREKIKQSPLYVQLDDDSEPDTADGFDISDIEEKYAGTTERDEYHVSPDKRTVALDVYPSGASSNLGFVRKVVAEVKELVTKADPSKYDPKMEVAYAGQFENRIVDDRIIREDVFGTLLYGLAAVIVVVSVYFRQPLTIVFLGLPLIMGISWTFGITYLVVGNLNLVTSFLFVVLFGLSIEFGVHLFYRYLDCRRDGLEVVAALELILAKTGRAMITSGATTATAFFSLLITDFRGFSEFGFIMGLGYLFCLVAMLTLFPALIIVSERWGFIRKPRPKASEGVEASPRPIPFARGVLFGGIVLTAIALALLPKLEFEYNFRTLRPYEKTLEKAKEKAGTIFTGSQSPVIVLADSKADMDQIVTTVREHIKTDTLSPTIERVGTIFDQLPQNQGDKLFTMQEIKTLLSESTLQFLNEDQRKRLEEFRELLDAEEVKLEDLPFSIRRRFIGSDGQIGNFVFIYPSVSLADGRNAIKFAEDVRDIRTPDGKVYHASSGDIIFADVLIVMIRDSGIATVATFLVVFFIVLLDLRSLRSALMVLLPLVIGIIWMCGAMTLLGMKINLFNMVVIPSVIGLSLDSGVHLYHRYLEEGAGQLWKVMMTTGQAVAIGAITTMLGFGDLVLARTPGLQSLGALAVLGLITTLVTALVLFPAALQVMDNWLARRGIAVGHRKS